MRVALMALLLLSLAGCSMVGWSKAEQTRKANLSVADAVIYGTVGAKLPRSATGGPIVTETQIAVVLGTGVEKGAQIIVVREGGKVSFSDGTALIRTVDYTYTFPEEEGSEVFLVLKRLSDNKYQIIDALPLRGGEPVQPRAGDQVYIRYLEAMKKGS